MSDESGDAGHIRAVTYDRSAASAAVACVACSLVAIGAIGGMFGLRRRAVGIRRWPAPKAVDEPADFTAPHGDKLRPRQ
jgi:hypothetical protein